MFDFWSGMNLVRSCLFGLGKVRRSSASARSIESDIFVLRGGWGWIVASAGAKLFCVVSKVLLQSESLCIILLNLSFNTTSMCSCNLILNIVSDALRY